MKKFKYSLIVLAIIVVVNVLFSMSHDGFGYSENAGSYKIIIAMICVIISMLLLKTPSQK